MVVQIVLTSHPLRHFSSITLVLNINQVKWFHSTLKYETSGKFASFHFENLTYNISTQKKEARLEAHYSSGHPGHQDTGTLHCHCVITGAGPETLGHSDQEIIAE